MRMEEQVYSYALLFLRHQVTGVQPELDTNSSCPAKLKAHSAAICQPFPTFAKVTVVLTGLA